MTFQSQYKSKLTSPEVIASQIQPGWSCCTDIGAAIPPAILNALSNRLAEDNMAAITLHTMLDLQSFDLLKSDTFSSMQVVSWFSGGGLRKAVNEGRADIMPCYYRDMPHLFDDYINVDAFFVLVSPMDQHGYFSVGVVGSNSEALLKKARHIYVEVNQNMPRALCSPTIHISQVTALCEADTPLPISPPPVIDDVSRTIGNLIADEVPNGATLQLGIGAVPEAVGLALKSKCELGIHTELFTDSMVELIQCGAVTNQLKPLHRGKTVATLAFGSQRIYDFINDNPTFLFKPVDYVNDPSIIAQHPNFISVNAALEVDLFGQVCAESMGTVHISGSGGQVDYVRGAIQSKGGKSFIAFPSTAKGGTISRITPTLSSGAIVTTSKNDVDHIVTEFGIAKLRGKTLSQRTKALIAIAHPKFRDELTFSAKKRNIII